MFVGFQYRHQDDSRITQQNTEVILNFLCFPKTGLTFLNTNRYEQFNASHQLIYFHSKVSGIKSNTSKSQHENNKET